MSKARNLADFISNPTVEATEIANGAVTSAKLSYPLTTFSSTGIDDNATSTAITIAANNSVSIPSLYGNITTADNLTVGGDFIVQGNNFTIDADSLRVEDSLIQLASNNETSDVIDIGFFGHYSNDGNTALHTGFFRDASDEQYYLFNGLEDADLDANNSVTTIDRSGTGFTLAALNVGALNGSGDVHFSTLNAKLTLGPTLNNTSGDFGIRSSTPQITLEPTADAQSSRIQFSNTSGTIWGSIFAYNDTERMQFSANTFNFNGGNVGIGTDSPARLLTLSASGAALLSLVSTDDDNCQVLFGDSASDTVGKILYRHSGDSMAFETNAAERMRIASSGNVGIGTTSPAELLHVYEASTNAARMRLGNTDGYIEFGTNNRVSNIDSQTHTFRNEAGSTEYMRINSSGLVGIGETNPIGILHLKSDDTGVVFQSSSSVNNRAQIFFQDSAGTQTGKISVDPDGGSANVMAFSTGTSERMRIDSSGNVGIGETDPQSLLHLSAVNPIITFTNTGGAVGEKGFRIAFDNSRLTFQRASDTGGFEANYLAIDQDSGKVGINQTNPAEKLDVSGNVKLTGQFFQSMPADFWSQGTTFIEINGIGNLTHQGSFETCLTSNGYRDNNNQWKSYAINSFTGAAQLRLNPLGHISFHTDSNKANGSNQEPTERIRIDADGIKFNGDTAAANGLDDYEEGTWTPALTYGGGNTGQVMTSNIEGTYVKIGSLVTSKIRCTQSTKGTSVGAVVISLPFAVANIMGTTALEAQGSLGYYQEVTVTHSTLMVTAWHSSSTVQFYYRATDTSTNMNALTDAHVGNGFDGRATITYRTT